MPLPWTVRTTPQQSPASIFHRRPKCTYCHSKASRIGKLKMDVDPPNPDPQPVPLPLPELPPPPPAGPAIPPPGPRNASDEFYRFWDRFTSKPRYPKISIVPSLDVDEEGQPTHRPGINAEGILTSQNATTSYEEARAACERKVDAIVNECKRLNMKFYDNMFDLPYMDTLCTLGVTEMPYSMRGLAGVGSVKRVEDIFDKPQFFEDGASATDICQGSVGDCWFLSAVVALSGKPELLQRICVKRDEQIGVYGFVFYRDGEWISEVVDDRLCLSRKDDKYQYPTEYMLKVEGNKSLRDLDIKKDDYWLQKLPKKFRDELRKGSDALYFSSCKSKNETWLPLLEKAYAKAHGDYQSIEGGFPGEGIEDLSGGVATYLSSEDILDKDKLWEELKQVNKQFLFGCGSRYGRDDELQDDEGFVRGHAYTVLEAREVKGYKPAVKDPEKPNQPDIEDLKMIKIRNPWGSTEWNGAWSDGSKEWTPKTMEELNHTFGDDGIFWIRYEDFLEYYPEIDRTRLFDDDWTVTQQWTSVEVPWTTDYLKTKFTFSLKKDSPVVLVLNQPDDRYFRGLTGRYDYKLHFRLYKDAEKTYLLRSMEDSGSGRSVSAELDLEAGDYTVYVKITARRDNEARTAQEVIQDYREFRRSKLVAVGTNFDLAHSKGKLREAEKEKEKRDRKEERMEARKENVLERNKKRLERKREKKREERIQKEKDRLKEEKIAEKKKRLAAQKVKDKAKKAARAAARGDRKVDADESKPADELSETKDEKAKSSNKKEEPEVVVIKGDAAHVDAPEPEVEVKPTTADTTKDTTATSTSTEAPKDEKKDEIKPEGPTPPQAADLPTPQSITNSPPASAHGRPTSRGAPSSSPREQVGATATPVVTPASSAQPTPTSSTDSSAQAAATSEVKSETKDTKETTDAKDSKDSKDSPASRSETTDLTGKSTTITLTVQGNTPRHDSSDSDSDSDVSDVSEDSVCSDDFEWDSELDGSVETESEEEELEGDDLYKDAPWNALCVVGLKVCHQGVKGEVEIGVVH